MHACCHFGCVQLFATPGTVARQAPLSVGFSRRECWSGLPFPSPGDLPQPGIEPASLTSPALASGFFTTSATCLVTTVTWCRNHWGCVCTPWALRIPASPSIPGSYWSWGMRPRKIKRAASLEAIQHNQSPLTFFFSGGLDFQRILEVLSAWHLRE